MDEGREGMRVCVCVLVASTGCEEQVACRPLISSPPPDYP